MLCPVDQTELTITDRQGVELDYCPSCRGVWLDRGELDKLLDRAAEDVPEPPRREERQSQGYKKKKKSFLSEFLEFGD